MISAQDARTITEASGVEVEKYLNSVVEPAIKKAAALGARSVFVHVMSIPTYQGSEPDYKASGAIKTLLEFGYRATWARDGEAYVPRGLADDDGNGVEHVNQGISIQW